AESFLAKAYMFENKYAEVRPLMEGLVVRLAHTEATLEGHDLGTADPITPLKTAESDFSRAVAEYNRRQSRLARVLFSNGLAAEKEARGQLMLVLTPTLSFSGTVVERSQPGTADVVFTPPSGGFNAFRLVTVSPDTIKRIYAPHGW